MSFVLCCSVVSNHLEMFFDSVVVAEDLLKFIEL